MAKTADFLVGVVVGSAIGAACALMYAPMSGVETREQLKLRADEAREKANELATTVRSRSTELLEQGRSRVGEISTQAQTMVDRGRSVIETQKEAVRSAVEAGKQAYTEKASELHRDVAADTQPMDTQGADGATI